MLGVFQTPNWRYYISGIRVGGARWEGEEGGDGKEHGVLLGESEDEACRANGEDEACPVTEGGGACHV